MYSKIQQAAKSTHAEIQWFGLVNKERKADPLLRYLFEARNDGEHGIARSVKHGADQYHIESATGGPVEITNFVPGPDGRLRLVGADGTEVAKVTQFIPGEATLQEIAGRDVAIKIPPPTIHLGHSIEPKPLIVADLGFRWIEALVATARAMHGP